ncbi:MAG TPA: AsmA family protein, partial [Wenzhouxiangella sp.]|nr:AsmA family protein [Wenzhouxiangella sp.]
MLRKIAVAVLILIVVLVLAVVAAVLLIDADDYREELAERASTQLGREVKLEGPMELRFFPWLALDIRDVTVGNPPAFDQAPPLAGIERATASIRVVPLLRGEIEVGMVTIERAGLHVVTARGGTSNLEGLFAPSDKAAEPDEPIDLSNIRTGTLRFENVVLSLIDLAAGSRTELQLDSLELDSFAAGKDVPLSLEGRLIEGSDTALTLDFNGSIRVAADLSEVALSDWTLNYTLPAAGVGGKADGSLAVNPTAEPLAIELSELTNRTELGTLVAELTARQPITASIGKAVRASLPGIELALNGDVLNLDGEASIGETISGQLAVTGERLDLSRLAPADADDASRDRQASQNDAAAQDLSALEMFDLSFSLDLGELVLIDGATLTQVTARSRLSGGKLTLDPLSA